MKKGFLLIKLFVLMVFAGTGQKPVYGQDIRTYEFSGEQLSHVLETIAASTDVNLIYDPVLVEGIFVYKRVRHQTFHETLRAVLDGTGLDFIILSSGTFVIVRASALAPEYGSFSGQITDSRTGEPLFGATVMLADASGGTVTGLSGNFNLNRLLTGSHEIIVSYVGYNPVKKRINIRPGENTKETIALKSRPFNVAPIVVSAHRPLMPTRYETEQGYAELERWSAGSGQGPIRSLALFPGVQYGIAMSDLHIQGGQRGEHRLFLDGAPVYNPYSFGNLFSAFSPYAIGRVSVDRAGFDASAGSFIAGKVNLSHDISNSTGRNALVQADPINTNLLLHLGNKTHENSRLHAMAAFRSSFWDLHGNAGLAGTLRQWDLVDPLTYGLLLGETNRDRRFLSALNATETDFHDFHFASRYRISGFQTLSYSMYAGRNFVQTDLLAREDVASDPVYMYSRDNYEWNNLITSLRFDWLATPRLDLWAQGSYSMNRLDHSYAMFDDGSIQQLTPGMADSERFAVLKSNVGDAFTQNDLNRIRHLIFSSGFGYSFSPFMRLNGGIQADYVESTFRLSDLFYLPTLSDRRSTFLGTWLNTTWIPSSGWTITAGSRFTALSPDMTVYAEPRLSIQYDARDTFLYFWSARLSGGIYRQFVNQFEITNVGPSTLVPYFTIWAHDSSIAQPKAYHAVLSFLIEPSVQTSITLEGFAKIQPSAYITSYHNLMVGTGTERTGLESFAEITDIQTYGGSLRLHQSLFDTRVKTLFGYDLTVSRVNMETQFGKVLPAPWIEPHRLQARAIVRLHERVTAVGNWNSALGRTWAFRQAYYDFMLTHNVSSQDGFDFTDPSSDKLSDFHQLDLSIIYAPDIGRGKMEVRLDLMNVLDRRNTVDWNLQPESTGAPLSIRERRLPGFTPSVSLSLSF